MIFFAYVNGTWLKTTEIPSDQVRWGAFMELRENNQKQLKDVFEKVSKTEAETGSDAQKIGDLYSLGMNIEKINAMGFDPIKEDLNNINAMKNLQGC